MASRTMSAFLADERDPDPIVSSCLSDLITSTQNSCQISLVRRLELIPSDQGRDGIHRARGGDSRESLDPVV